MIVRLWNLADQPSSYSLSLNNKFSRCLETTHVETDLREVKITEGKVNGTLNSGAMQTLRFI